jgi:glycerol kinase
MMKYLLAVDQGTTGSTALITDLKLNLISKNTKEFKQHYPKPGWVEHDLEEIWASVSESVKVATAKLNVNDICAIGITNQRETICFWDKETLTPLRRAIVWQDRRTSDQCHKLVARGIEKNIHKKTGLLLDPYFSGTKVAWAIKNDPVVKKALKDKRLAIGTIDSFLIARFTGGLHYTDASNASRTLCYDILKGKWDRDLCKLFLAPESIWPKVRSSFGDFGKTKSISFLPNGIPITGVLGDQQAALLGQACIEPGSAKCTYGTGAFMLMNTGAKPVFSKSRLLTTIAWMDQKGKTTYALEGSAFIAGAAVQWLRDGLGIIKSSSEVEALAASVESSEGVVFVPALTGLGAPHWNPSARGLLSGITRGTTKAHIARATLEGIAFQNFEILSAMKKDSKLLKTLGVDGGASNNNLLMQFQADILGIKLKRPKMVETTALGALFAAGLGLNIWKNLSDIRSSWSLDREFIPKMSKKSRDQSLINWKAAVKKTIMN